MPTFDWVREGDQDRYLEAMEQVPDPTGPLAPSYLCPICGQVFARSSGLQAHVVDNHQITPPVMVVEGREPMADHVVRHRLKPKDVVVANATSIAVMIDRSPWASIAAGQLGAHLTGIDLATVRIRLVNGAVRGTEPVERTYSLSFRIAGPATLRAVDAAFRAHLTSGDIDRATVADFLADARCQGLGRDYADGLAEYVLGLIVKEQPFGEALVSPLARYRSLFGASLLKLEQHARPSAQLLCSIMRFSLNDFSRGATTTGYAELDAATAMLQGPKGHIPGTPPVTPDTPKLPYPVDHGTSRILALAARLSRETRWGPVLRDECSHAADMPSLDVGDRDKVLALWALTAWRLGANDDAAAPLARIAGVYPFASWARPCLDAVNK